MGTTKKAVSGGFLTGGFVGANTFGTHFQITTFGESHGPAVGVVIEGCPAGLPFSLELINEKLNRRRPGKFPWISDRKEPDRFELISGVFEGRTLGTPLTLLIKNRDFKSEDYDRIKNNPRPGHADDVWKNKFGHADHRGGGRASGRETIGRVLSGAVAEMFLKKLYAGLRVTAFATQIGPFIREEEKPSALESSALESSALESSALESSALESSALESSALESSALESSALWFGSKTKEVENFLIQKKAKGLSYGGTVQVVIEQAPAGLGQPVFRKLKSDMACAFMSIGACYEVSLGEQAGEKGREISYEEGSALHRGKTAGVYGGIRGGISTGEKIIFHLKFKPPASVLETAKKGRHDPCIVPRALVVVEAMAWLVMADHVLWSRQDRVS